MSDKVAVAVTNTADAAIKKTTSFFGANPLKKVGYGLGSLVFPPLATFASSKNQFIDGIKKSGALDTLKETGLVKDDFMQDQALSPREEAARQVKGSFKKTRAYSAETEFWDRLYDEPCWINPATGSFELGTAFSDLWCTWFMNDDPSKQIEKLMGNRSLLFRTVLDKEKLNKIYLEKNWNKDISNPKGKISEAINIFLGEVDENKRSKKEAELLGNGDKASQFVPHSDTGKKEALANRLNLSVEDLNQAIEQQAAGPVSLLSSSPTGILKQTEVSLDEETRPAAGCNKSKWFFCLFMKFLLGPAGLLILKFMPYVIQLLLNIWNFFGRLFLGFSNSFLYRNQRAYVYKNQFNETVKDYYPNYVSTVASYIGLVFPWKILSYDKGQRYGNGEFGKFIFSLMLLSVGLITMGSITIVVFLLVLSYYLVKTLSMFTSNIDSKKKK